MSCQGCKSKCASKVPCHKEDILLRPELKVESKPRDKPPGFFFGAATPKGRPYWPMDRMDELPDSEPIKIAFKQYEQEQIKRTKRKDWWNCD